MGGTGDPISPAPPPVPSDLLAEAAVWIARLHGPGRDVHMERECLAWQARSAAHRAAFEKCTDTWQAVPGVTLASAYAGAAQALVAPPVRRTGPLRWTAALGVGVVLLGGVLGFQHWRTLGSYSTGVGEQQVVLLDDGTRMSLNTSTRLRVDLTQDRRQVDVQSGEAVFEVAKDTGRPFVVRVGDSEVEALGTTFSVRYTAMPGANSLRLAVTLIEGQVAVRPAKGAVGGSSNSGGKRVLMQAGERARWAPEAAAAATGPQLDRPDIDQLMAWRRSEAVFDSVALADAVAEMNRYNRTPIVLLDVSAMAGLRVSGLYRTGDSAGFARAVARLHGLRVQEGQGRLALAKPQ